MLPAMRSADEQNDFLEHDRFDEGEKRVAANMPATVWKATAIVGICLIIVGIAAGYVDVATHFRLEFLSDHFNIFLIAVLVGVLASSVGLIGWARLLKRCARARMVGLVFVSPWITVLLGYPIAGNNIHGPSALVLLLIIPGSILAVILLMMAGLMNSQRL
jgi:hypothetical protein